MANHFRIVESEGLTDGEEQLEAIAEDVAAEPLPDLETPAESTQLAFLDVLMKSHSQSMLRRSRGKDVSAACGQLRLRNISPCPRTRD